MHEQLNIPKQSHTANHEIESRYMDPKSDFAFKHFFGKEPHKDLLIKFLNSLFKGRKVIIDIQHNNPEHKGMRKAYRKTVFDLYCTGDKGERFIVEMQKADKDYFKDRIIFYTANLIQEQGISVNSDWDYELPEVYFIAILNFTLKDSPVDHYVHDVRLIEVNTNHQFYHKLGYIFVELPKFGKNEDELKTDQDYWLYMLKNLHCFDEIPVALSDKEEFVKFFEIAEVSNLSQEDMNAYQQNLKILRDDYSDRQTTLNKFNRLNREMVDGIAKGHAEGKDEGHAEGRIEGQAVEKQEIALEMKNNGEPVSKIIRYTRLTIEEIEAL